MAAMLPPEFMDPSAERRKVAAGVVLLKRGSTPAAAIYVESGRVALGVLEDQSLAHQLGEIQGPSWLEATGAVLGLSSVVDAVAETEVQLRRIPLARFRQSLAAMPAKTRSTRRPRAAGARALRSLRGASSRW